MQAALDLDGEGVDLVPGAVEAIEIVQSAATVLFQPNILTIEVLQFRLVGFEENGADLEFEAIFARLAGLPVEQHNKTTAADDRSVKYATQIDIVSKELSWFAVDRDPQLEFRSNVDWIKRSEQRFMARKIIW